MKLVQLICLCLLVQFSSKAQDQNYLSTNISYTFFGTGDLQGTAIGLDYHRTLWKRLGFHLGYSKATGQEDRLNLIRNNQDVISNAIFIGNDNNASDLANYQTYLVGLNYKITAGARQTLFVSGGLNYKTLTYNYIGAVLFENIDPQGNAEQATILDYQFLAEKEVGIYGGLDYLFVFDNSVSLGLHFVVENSSNILTKAGLSIGFRF